nr:hypothetical protein [uncultured Campylobacter sp.]
MDALLRANAPQANACIEVALRADAHTRLQTTVPARATSQVGTRSRAAVCIAAKFRRISRRKTVAHCAVQEHTHAIIAVHAAAQFVFWCDKTTAPDVLRKAVSAYVKIAAPDVPKEPVYASNEIITFSIPQEPVSARADIAASSTS